MKVLLNTLTAAALSAALLVPAANAGVRSDDRARLDPAIAAALADAELERQLDPAIAAAIRNAHESAPIAINQRQMEQAAEQTVTMNQRQMEEEAARLRFVNQRQMELAADESSPAARAPDNRADRRLPGLSARIEAASRSSSSGLDLGGVEVGLGIAAALALLGGTGLVAARRRGKVAHS